MGDMSPVIVPRSDQINAEDLLSGPMTVKVTAVNIAAGTEQPVSISFEGSKKFFRPCKTMCKLMVKIWGPDSKNYIGKSMTLYCDPKVKWGGMEVGGIRISHMSDITAPVTTVLAESRAVKKPITVQLLKQSAPPRQAPVTPPATTSDTAADLSVWADEFEHTLDTMTDLIEARARINAAVTSPEYERLKTDDPERKAQLASKAEGLLKRLKAGAA